MDFIHKKLPKYFDYLKNSKSILEIGFGRGEFLELCAKAGQPVAGIDFDPLAVKSAKAKGFKVSQGEAVKLLSKAKAGAHGAVFCSNVAEHLEPKDLIALVKHIARVLPKGGRLGIATSNTMCLDFYMRGFWIAEHVRPYSRESLKEILEQHGFRVDRADADEDTRPQSFLRSAVRAVRTLIVGDYFQASEICVLAEKVRS